MIGAGKRLVHLAPGKFALEYRVGGQGFVHPRTVRTHCGECVYHRLEWLVFHLDQLQRIFSNVATACRNGCDRLAHVVHLVGCQAVEACSFGIAARYMAPAPHIIAGDHGAHSGELFRSAGIDTPDSRMGMRTVQDRAVEHPGKTEVIDELGASGHQLRILETTHFLADPAAIPGGNILQSRLPGVVDFLLHRVRTSMDDLLLEQLMVVRCGPSWCDFC